MAMSSKKIGKMVSADVDKALANISASTPKPDMKADDTVKKAAAPSRGMTFAERFKYERMAAKAAGLDPNKQTFTYNGKSYSTRMAGEGGSKPAAKSTTPKSSASSSPVGDFYLNKYPKIKGNAANIRGVSAAESAAAQAKAGRSNVPAGKSSSAGPRDNSAAGRRARMGKVFSALNPFGYADNEKFAASQKAKGYKKGGSVDGIAIRGKTRAPMKKGK